MYHLFFHISVASLLFELNVTVLLYEQEMDMEK